MTVVHYRCPAWEQPLEVRVDVVPVAGSYVLVKARDEVREFRVAKVTQVVLWLGSTGPSTPMIIRGSDLGERMEIYVDLEEI